MQRLLNSFQGNVKKKVNAHDDEGLSALHYASRYNHVGICKLLIEAGASTLADADCFKWFLLVERTRSIHIINFATSIVWCDVAHRACILKALKKLLICNLYHAEKFLHLCVYVHWCTNIVAAVNDKDPEGATPLHFAARYKRVRLRPSDAVSHYMLTCALGYHVMKLCTWELLVCLVILFFT